jgi:hypothetical protein
MRIVSDVLVVDYCIKHLLDVQIKNVDKVKGVFLHPYFFINVELNLKTQKYVC